MRYLNGHNPRQDDGDIAAHALSTKAGLMDAMRVASQGATSFHALVKFQQQIPKRIAENLC